MRLPSAAALLAACLVAAACAHPTPTKEAVAIDGPASDETLIDVAALAEVSRGLLPNDTVWVEPRTRGLFDSDSAADAWATQAKEAMQRVPMPLLKAYARANVDASDIILPRSVRSHPIARPRTAPALATPLVQIFTLTRPGLNLAGDSAYVIVTRTCGLNCGRRSGLLAVRDRDRWRIASTLWYDLR